MNTGILITPNRTYEGCSIRRIMSLLSGMRGIQPDDTPVLIEWEGSVYDMTLAEAWHFIPTIY